jgi:hypothetical protein
MINVNDLQALPDKAIVERLDNLIAGSGSNIIKDGTTGTGGNPSNLTAVWQGTPIDPAGTKTLLVGGQCDASDPDIFVQPIRLDGNGNLVVIDQQIYEQLNTSTKQGNKVYGLDNSGFPLLSDNWLNRVVVTNQAGLHAVLNTINYNLLQDATAVNFKAMIPNTYTLNITHTNAVTNDIIVSVCACFTTL